MIGEGVIIFEGVLTCYSVSMPMAANMAVVPIVRMAESESKIVVTSIAGCRFRRRHKHTLQGKCDCRRQHHRDGNMLQRSSASRSQKVLAPQPFPSEHGILRPLL